MTRAQGFTLVELLIAITLFALLSVMLFGALRFGTRAIERGTLEMERSAEIAAATNFLRNQWADAQPFKIKGFDGRSVVAFEGKKDSAEFVTLPPAHLAPGGWYTLRLAIEGQQLVVRWRLVRAGDKPATIAAPQTAVLLDRVKTVEYGYFGTLPGTDLPQWYERWQEVDTLPFLVRMRITFADGTSMPDVIVALRPAGIPLKK